MPRPLDLLDVDDTLTDDERAVRDSTRRFVDEQVQPLIAGAYRAGTFCWEIVPGLAKLGLLGAPLSTHGCAGLSPVAYWLALAELERADSGVRSFASVQTSLVMFPIAKFGSDAQKDRWLPLLRDASAIGCFGLTEPDAGSDPAAMKTTAKKTATGWTLTGTKRWITNGTRADVALIWAKTEAPESDSVDGKSIRGFLVEKGSPGFTQTAIPHKQSFRCSDTAELNLDGVDVDDDALLAGTRGLGSALACLAEARSGIAMGVTGSADACLTATLAFVADRVSFGRPIAGHQLAQEKLANMAVELSLAKLLSVRMGRLKEAGKLAPVQISVGKMNNVRACLQIARTCRELLGANGITDDYPVMRHMCNLETVYTYEGTHDVHTLVVGAFLTGQAAFGR
jgi:glutaryl-CoA dehydrogenase